MATADIKAVTKFFLDRSAVAQKVRAGKLRGLGKFGSFVRTSARSSIRKAKKSAPPGEPPRSHRGDLRRLIFFSVDPETSSVVIGPVLFPKARPQSIPAQQALEYAGTVTRRVEVPAPTPGRRKAGPRQAKAFARLVKAGRLPKPAAKRVESRTFRYRGNPFMAPAFEKNLTNPKLADCLRDVIR